MYNTKNTIIGCTTAVVLILGGALVGNKANDDSNQRRNECAEAVTHNLSAGTFTASDIQAVAEEVCK